MNSFIFPLNSLFLTSDDPAVHARLNECLETILNKAQVIKSNALYKQMHHNIPLFFINEGIQLLLTNHNSFNVYISHEVHLLLYLSDSMRAVIG